MCGIYGLVTAKAMGLFQEEENFLKNMLIVNAVRGEDGAGMFWVGKQDPKKCHSIRKADNPYWLMLNHKQFPQFFKQAGNQAKVVVGHHRYATKGANKDENTHPFREGPITMVHNGTISWGLDPFPKGVEVDSHALTIALAEKGVQIFADIFGAFACVWHDARDGTLHIAKNDQRPLNMVRNKGTLYFASELGMLDFVLGRCVQGYWEAREIVPVNNKVHYIYNIESGEWSQEPLPEKKYHTTPPQQNSRHGSNNKPVLLTAAGSDDNEEKLGAFDVVFNIIGHIKSYQGNTALYTYQGVTEDKEACFFRSNKQFIYTPESRFFGRAVDVEVGKFASLGSHVPWYRIKPSSVVELQSGFRAGQNILSQEELNKALKARCFCCKAEVTQEEVDVELCDSIQVSSHNYRLICPKCTESKAFEKLSQGFNDATVVQ
jgi:hypothetical protein